MKTHKVVKIFYPNKSVDVFVGTYQECVEYVSLKENNDVLCLIEGLSKGELVFHNIPSNKAAMVLVLVMLMFSSCVAGIGDDTPPVRKVKDIGIHIPVKLTTGVNRNQMAQNLSLIPLKKGDTVIVELRDSRWSISAEQTIDSTHLLAIVQ